MNNETTPATPSVSPINEDAERRLEQQAWRIVRNHGPAWWNLYTRKYPNSKSSEQFKRDEMAHYCVVAALREQAEAVDSRDAALRDLRAITARELDIQVAALREAREERDRLRAAAMPPKDGPHECGLHGHHGGPLCSMRFAYEDGTVRHIGHGWYVNLQAALARSQPVTPSPVPIPKPTEEQQEYLRESTSKTRRV